MSLTDLLDRTLAAEYTIVAIAQIGHLRFEKDFPWLGMPLNSYSRATKFFPMRQDERGESFSDNVPLETWNQWADRVIMPDVRL